MIRTRNSVTRDNKTDTEMEENGNLASKLRAEDADQFYTLVRMHLSFVLDLNSEDCEVNPEKKGRQLKWNLPFAKKTKGAPKPSEQLTKDVVQQMNALIEFLRKPDCICQEGIFRRTGKLKRQQELKMKLMSNDKVDLDCGDYSVHDCASVFKTYLSELPEPLLTEAHYPAYCQVAQLNGNEDRLLLALQLLILLLPTDNHAFLQHVLSLLHLASQHADTNRMSSTNLATLFTPHLLWPRRLAAETLQANANALSLVVAFMIENTDKLFMVPTTLATDIRVYWEKKERRQRSPKRLLNESVCDGTTASTVFTFVDRERTAQENGANPTELALAQLYAHIQSLPDSARKRRLVKNFNKKNGQGTPAVRNEERNKHRRSRSLRDSIKKHLVGFSKNGKAIDDEDPISNESMSPEPLMKTPLLPPSLSKSRRMRPQLKQELFQAPQTACKENRDPLQTVTRSKSCDTLLSPTLDSKSSGTKRSSPETSIENRPAKRTPPLKPKSPATVPLVIPTKRPTTVLRPSPGSLARTLKPTSPPDLSLSLSLNRGTSASSLRRSKKMAAPQRSSPRFHTPTPVSVSSLRVSEHGLPCVTNPTPQRNRYPCTSTPAAAVRNITTSTPATRTPVNRNACLLTPRVERNSSMSPITRSAQRMPRAMQETMMTPRSRKPVVSLSGSDLCHLTSLEPWTPEKHLILEESESSAKDSLSSTFRDYLVSRSVLTASPVDLSFSSRTDDYQSLSGKTSSLDELQSLESRPMSNSLLFCLDGNDPDVEAATATGAVGAARSSHVCETAI